VHRDIKPDNVLLTKHHAVVTDFGVAKAVSEATGAQKLTTEGVALGTPAYMSPEQAAADSHIDHRADIYAVGVVAYELLTGRTPFLGTTPQMILSAHMTDTPEPVSKYRESVPPPLEQLVMRCLEKKAADRWQSAEDLLPHLEALVTPSGGITPTGTMPVDRVAKGRWMTAGAAVAVVALVVALWQPWASEDVAAEGASWAWTILAEVEGSAPEDTRSLVGSLLAGDIDASGSLLTLPQDQILRGLASAMKPDTTSLTQSVARELAERGGIGTVFAPELDLVGGTYALTVRVLHAAGDSVLATERVSAANDDALIPASREVVETLIPILTVWMGGEVRRPRANPPVTSSLAAFRKHQEAQRANALGRYHEAIALFREALAIDPDFAAAWVRMGGAYSNARFRDSAEYAEDQRLNLEARLAGDWVARFQRSERQYRETGIASNAYAAALADGMGRYEDAVAIWEQMAEQSPFGTSDFVKWNLASILLCLGRVEEAEAVARRLEGTPRELPVNAKIALRKGNWGEAERLAVDVARDPAMSVRFRSDAIWVLASARAAQGRIHEAVSALHEMIRTNQRPGRELIHRRAHLNLLILTIVGGLTAEAWDLERLQADTTEEARVLSGLWAAELGDTAFARSYLEELPVPEFGEFAPSTHQEATVAALHARVAGRRLDWEEAVRLLAPVTGDRTPRGQLAHTQLLNWVVAEAYEELGHLDSAVKLYSGIADGYRFVFDEVNGFGLTYSFAHREAALLYGQLGQDAEAIEHWRAFLDAFTDPDPEFEWMMEEARVELERLRRGR
jgi:tetratricopeptide (TPR) repeat protein